MATSSYTNSYLFRTGDNISPVSPLDNMLYHINCKEKKVRFYNYLNGDELNSRDEIDKFYEGLVKNAETGKYATTDHLIYCVVIGGVNFLYVSLDNSVRSNMNNMPLAHTRLDNLMIVLEKILTRIEKTIVIFSESCRPSFYGNITERKEEIAWLEMRKTISDRTNLQFITDKRNNEDLSSLSFGLSVWCTNDAYQCIDTYYNKSILDKGFGSVAIGIKLKSGEIVWGVHFPLDFKGKSSENLGAITMSNLIKMMNDYTGSVVAFGDMNTIPGDICQAIQNAANGSNYSLLLDDVYTFFGSYFDTIPMKESLPFLLDLDENKKYNLLNYV